MFSYKINLVLYILSTVICIIILNVYFSCFFQKSKKLINWIIYFVYMAWQMFLFIESNFPAYINLIIGIILNSLVSLICFKGNVLQKVALSGILSILWTLSEFLVGYFFIMLGINYKYPQSLGALISEIVVLIMIFSLCKYFQMNNIKNLPTKCYLMLLFLPIGSLFIVYKIFMYGSLLEQGLAIKESAVCVIIMLFINLLIFRLCLLLADELVLRKYNAVYTQQLEIYSKNMQEREISMAEYRSAKHDMKQHFISLLSMLQEHHYEMAEKYLNNLVQDNRKNLNICRTGNLIVDAIINAKYSLMKTLGIECFVDIHIPMWLSFEMADISVLIGNVLDNAIEANNIEMENKYIKIYMAYDKNILIVTVINSYDGKLIKDKNGKFLTRKQDKFSHGFGLNSIEKIVHKYHGSVVIENSFNEFKIKFIMFDNKR